MGKHFLGGQTNWTQVVGKTGIGKKSANYKISSSTKYEKISASTKYLQVQNMKNGIYHCHRIYLFIYL